jgi:hypothetical protein
LREIDEILGIRIMLVGILGGRVDVGKNAVVEYRDFAAFAGLQVLFFFIG